MENFLIWSRIIQIIDTLVLRFMALRATWEKVFMESITYTRAQKSRLVSDNSAKLRFAYRFSSRINPSAVSRISGVISFFNFLMSCRWTKDNRVRALSYSLMEAT